MPLTIGSRLGSYDIVAPLGAGGMGEVYRACDTTLNRDVALKILPDAFANDPDRLARFTREAQTLAALNHPHIAHIYGLERQERRDGQDARAGTSTAFIVMELVEGEDLAQRIARGPIPIDEALPIAKQIAEALEAAHEQGIIHRDLKPANIKVRPDGAVKVLDFGLAKAIEGSSGPGRSGGAGGLSMSPTIMSPAALTGAGIILGTAAYMAPEQTRGATVDKRADVWSFGVVVFEMLTGRRLFEGDAVSDTLAAVLRQEIDWRRLPPDTPAALEQLLHRSLERDPKRRLRDIGEARIALESPVAASVPAASAVAPRARRRSTHALIYAAIAVAFGAGAASAVWLRWGRGAPDVLAVRLSATVPVGVSVDATFQPNLAISHDGMTVAFTAGNAEGTNPLYVRTLNGFDVRPLPGTEQASAPFFSPDDAWIGFSADGKLKKTPSQGGPVVTLAAGGGFPGAVWTAADTIVFSSDWNTGLSEIPAAGGPVRSVTTLDVANHERTHRWVSVTADAKTLLFNVGVINRPDDYEDATIEAVRRDTGVRRVVMKGGRMPRLTGSGDLLFIRGTILYAVGFDQGRLDIHGTPRPLIDGVVGDPATGAALYAVSDTGTLAYVYGDSTTALRRLAWVDADGAATPIDLPPALYADPDVSPDGRLIAFSGIEATSGNADVWIADVARGSSSRLTSGGINRTPAWSPDGKTLFYVTFDGSTSRSTVVARAADGGGAIRQVGSIDGPAYLTQVTPDGAALLTAIPPSANGNTSIYRLPLSDGAANTPRIIVPAQATVSVSSGTVSPDNRWIAYLSIESGNAAVVVQALTAGGSRRQISSADLIQPHWSHDGKAIYFQRGNEMVMVAVEQGGLLAVGRPRKLFGDLMPISLESRKNFDVSSTGRFLLMRPMDERRAAPDLRILTNWFADIGRPVRR